jgi:Alpha amylase, catalytic domain
VTTHPALYQINTRVLLSHLSIALSRPATLDDVPDAELDRLAAAGFDWLWFLGVWLTGTAGRKISLENSEWLTEYRQVLPEYCDDDVCGSSFAITGYSVHPDFGGDRALERLRSPLHARGKRLLLDFVPNHTAPDHPWAALHPEFYFHATEEEFERNPRRYARIGGQLLAYGRDPNFDGWPDTLQLNYAEPALWEAMASELENIAAVCDGVRCDMAMLIVPEVFERTWSVRPAPFWPEAIRRARKRNPNFLFVAEVYWDMEWELQQQGFDYTYDKRLYDRLREGEAQPVRDHLRADFEVQRKSVRFIENHDERRAADAFTPAVHQAAAVVAFFCPGMRFFHQGQLEGRRNRIPVHLRRGPAEEVDPALFAFYDRLLACLRRSEAHDGEWRLLECVAAWDGNPTAPESVLCAGSVR